MAAKEYTEVLRFRLFNNNLTKEEAAKKFPVVGNSNLGKTKDIPDEVTLVIKPTRVEGGMRYLAGGGWKYDDGNVAVALQYVFVPDDTDEVQDDFD